MIREECNPATLGDAGRVCGFASGAFAPFAEVSEILLWHSRFVNG